MKWMEFLCDVIVWVSITAAMLAFIFGIYAAPLWVSIMTSILLLAVLVLWD